MSMTKQTSVIEPPSDIYHFKNLLFDLSAEFINTSLTRLGDVIDNTLEVVSRYWGFDAAFLSVIGDDGVDSIHTYMAPHVGKRGRALASRNEIPWLMNKIMSGESVSQVRLPQELPTHAVKDREFCIRHGVKSNLSLPFKTSTSITGVFTIVCFRRYQSWSPELTEALQRLTQILAGILEKKQAIERLDEFLQFEHLLSTVSTTYIDLPVDRCSLAVKNDLGRLGRLLGADRCVLYSAMVQKGQLRWSVPFVWRPEIDEALGVGSDNWESDSCFCDDFHYASEKWLKSESVVFADPDELPFEATRMKKALERSGVKSYLSTPISVTGSILWALVIATTRAHRTWPEHIMSRLRLFGEVLTGALLRKMNEEDIRSSFFERSSEEPPERIQILEEPNVEDDFVEIVGQSDAFKQVLIKVRQVAPTNATVLLTGETGTGKGLIARAIHKASKRNNRPLMQVNCAALSPTLIESELFGHERGSFTGALTRRAGRFEAAHGGTLFLDEIGDLPLELQPKFLRVLQDGEFERVGGTATIKTDVRVIAATNRDLNKEVAAGRFRADLWYRLSVFPIFIPPLRERLEDIPLIMKAFVDKYGKGRNFNPLRPEDNANLRAHPWPGNIRELENIVERAVITSTNGNLYLDLPSPMADKESTGETLEEIERRHILKVIEEHGWKIDGLNGAASCLGLKPSTLRFRAKKLGIKRPARG